MFALVTTLLDPDTAPASDLAELYHQRWHAETGIADLKTVERGGLDPGQSGPQTTQDAPHPSRQRDPLTY